MGKSSSSQADSVADTFIDSSYGKNASTANKETTN